MISAELKYIIEEFRECCRNKGYFNMAPSYIINPFCAFVILKYGEEKAPEEIKWSYLRTLDKKQIINNLEKYFSHWLFFMGQKHPEIEFIATNYIFDSTFVEILFPDVVRTIDKIVQIISEDSTQNWGTVVDYVFVRMNQQGIGRYEEFSTPAPLDELMVELSGINNSDIICDPCCGMGNLLIKVKEKMPDCLVKGYDISKGMLYRMKLYCLSHGIDIETEEINSLTNANRDYDAYSKLIMNPPMQIQIDKDCLREDLKTSYIGKSSDNAFIALALNMLEEGGKCVTTVPASFLTTGLNSTYELRKKLIEENSLEAVILLPSGMLMPLTGAVIALLVFRKGGTTEKVWFYDLEEFGYTHDKRRIKIDKSDIPDLLKRYSNLDGELDNEQGAKSVFIDKAELAEYNYELNIKRYKAQWKVEKLLKDEENIPLSKMAEVLTGNRGNETERKTLTVRDFKYPLDCQKVKYGKNNGIKLQKGDIVVSRIGLENAYLISEELEEELYAGINLVVIRPTKIQPEYLYMYLLSDTGRAIFQANTKGVTVSTISSADIRNFPIIIPKKSAEEYTKLFKIRHYMQIDMSVYNKLLEENFIQEPESVEDILNIELAEKLKTYKQEKMKSFLVDDLNELNICFKGKAYKATLILAGSILEAVLIDWLSEIHHKDYFNEDYMITDRRTGREKRADLVDYINEIKYIERPHWMEEATKAHEIRKKRNLVHAKLCINSDEINETVCRQVIDYLRDVLKTRGVQ